MKLLHVDSSILGANSVSHSLSHAVVDRLRAGEGHLEITTRDVVAHPISHLTGAYLAGLSPNAQHDQAMQEEVSLGGAVLAEFLAADIVVLGVPMYNFGIPSQLKAWVDRVLVAGKTFHYTDKGAVGLAGGKRVILALARGGKYGPETPNAAAEHQESYLRTVFGFMGITDIESITAEGVAMGPEARTASVEAAMAEIGQLK